MATPAENPAADDDDGVRGRKCVWERRHGFWEWRALGKWIQGKWQGGHAKGLRAVWGKTPSVGMPSFDRPTAKHVKNAAERVMLPATAQARK